MNSQIPGSASSLGSPADRSSDLLGEVSADQIATERLAVLNRRAIQSSNDILAVLERLRASGGLLRSGFTSKGHEEVGIVESCAASGLVLVMRQFEQRGRRQIFFRFALNESTYFFAALLRGVVGTQRLSLALPDAIFEVERRFASRYPAQKHAPSEWAHLIVGPRRVVSGRVLDRSDRGLAVEVSRREAHAIPEELTIRMGHGSQAARYHARVRYRDPAVGQDGWVRFGMSTSTVPGGKLLPVDTRDAIVDQNPIVQRIGVLAGMVRSLPRRTTSRIVGLRQRSSRVPIVEFLDADGRRITAIADSVGDPKGAPAVVIPPAWGKTKETLLPLAATILESFRRARRPVTVLRFDGVNRRGESWKAEGCEVEGKEHLRFSFSQAAADIASVVDYLERSPRFATTDVALVTFSAASVEGRRAMAQEAIRGRLRGWVSVVGMPDLQYSMRETSGGIDYAFGCASGVRFGLQEVLGVLVDMDYCGPDAVRSGLAFLEDAKRDMEKITAPVTWIHGRHDGWMDIARVRELLSSGSTKNRRLIEVPTGHQLRSSLEALQTFKLVSQEVGRILIGDEIRARTPDVGWLEDRRREERQRLTPRPMDLRQFWEQYLLGRDRSIGMELLTSTTPYQAFLDREVELLEMKSGDVVADLGAGTGAFQQRLSVRPAMWPRAIVSFDLVRSALARALGVADGKWSSTAAVVDFDRSPVIPLSTGSCDAVLASLLLSYIRDPLALLKEARRVLRPGGRVVVSSLRLDADISKIYREGISELRDGLAERLFSGRLVGGLAGAVRNFLNDAAKLLDLEEQGVFRFWDSSELAQMARQAGFESIAVEPALGSPPQAIVLKASV